METTEDGVAGTATDSAEEVRGIGVPTGIIILAALALGVAACL